MRFAAGHGDRWSCRRDSNSVYLKKCIVSPGWEPDWSRERKDRHKHKTAGVRWGVRTVITISTQKLGVLIVYYTRVGAAIG